MIKVAILAFDYALGTTITGVVDLLMFAGVTWNRINDLPVKHFFDVKIYSADGGMIHCVNGLTMMAHGSFNDIDKVDVVLVPTIAGNVDVTLAKNTAIIDTLQRIADNETLIASNCTGAFFLAEAGLLDHKAATTHWGFVNEFKRKYPAVKLQAEQLVSHDGNILCAGGGNAWFDLGLYLIERFCDHETAVGTAKAFVLDMGRSNQLTYSPILNKRYHNDELVLNVQDYMEKSFDQTISLERMAEQFNLSTRTLSRRFKQATGETPNHYLQTIRLEAARKLLEETSLSLPKITLRVGYEDVSSFSVLFKKNTGVTPGSYRDRYRRRY
jgi:transcriptional regulator GlxA family with amidase domain